MHTLALAGARAVRVRGALPYETGPPTEPCGTCDGRGFLFDDPDLRGLFAAMAADQTLFTSPESRLLIRGLEKLEERIGALERDKRQQSFG